jgi:predicted kinase
MLSGALSGPRPLLIVVEGLPAAGKTVVASWIAREFHLPFLQKDGFKEALFDMLGWSDRQWSQRLSSASNALLLYAAGAILAAGQDVVIESNFHAEPDAPRLRALLEAQAARVLQVHCRAAPEVLWQRFVARAGQRHPGHADHLYLEEFRWLLQAPHPLPLDLGGEVIEVDTTDLQAVDHARLRKAVLGALSPEAGSR